MRERGHEVLTLDYDPKFGSDIVADILEWDPASLPWRPDLIVASPPCEGFTVMNIGRNWTGPDDDPPHQPKSDSARLALRIAEATRRAIDALGPAFFVIENPVAKLRKLPVFADLDRATITQCRYGETRMKPTDLWGGFPPSFEPLRRCQTRKGAVVDIDGVPWVLDEISGRPCHVSAPRGSKTPGSVQGQGSPEERAKIPRKLSLAVCEAAEWDLAARNAALLEGARERVGTGFGDDAPVLRDFSQEAYG